MKGWNPVISSAGHFCLLLWWSRESERRVGKGEICRTAGFKLKCIIHAWDAGCGPAEVALHYAGENIKNTILTSDDRRILHFWSKDCTVDYQSIFVQRKACLYVSLLESLLLNFKPCWLAELLLTAQWKIAVPSPSNHCSLAGGFYESVDLSPPGCPHIQSPWRQDPCKGFVVKAT